MWQIKPTPVEDEIVCAEIPGGPMGFVTFGASGDLVGRKLLPSIFELYKRGLLSENFFFLGCGRKKYSDSQYRDLVCKSVESMSENKKQLDNFLGRSYFESGNYDDSGFYEVLKKRVRQLGSEYKTEGNTIFYLAVPPILYTTIVNQLGQSRLSCGENIGAREKVKLVIEKPFGRDLQSALELDKQIHQCFDEKQIYRIDHYLGKETVQNILIFRFTNTIFEPIWNRNYIDHVQITAAESLGIEGRGGYYDKTGAFRDMFQNHMLQMLALAAMEPPTSFEADRIRDEKAKLLRSIRPFDLERLDEFIVRGQYCSTEVNGRQVGGYLAEQNVEAESKTETYVASKLFVDNWRWKDVPFYLRSGKAMKHKDTEIAITFKKIPHSMFVSSGLEEMPPNVLVLQIQPEEGMSLSFQAKRPGSKLCMGTLNMNFSYGETFDVSMPEAYQRLLLDCMVGDQTLFTRKDAVKTSWELITPVLQAWEKDLGRPFEYPAGSESFGQADKLIESDGRKWRKLASE